jgi:hypothetical protein
MTLAEIKRAYLAKPFKPFALKLADGSRLRVKSPEFLAFFPGGRTVLVVKDDADYEIIDLLLVTSLDFAARRARNGHST